MSVRIRPEDVGKRISVQFYDDDGTRNEAIGHFERAERAGDDVIFHVRRKDDSLARVPLSRIRFGKVVEPRTR